MAFIEMSEISTVLSNKAVRIVEHIRINAVAILGLEIQATENGTRHTFYNSCTRDGVP